MIGRRRGSQLSIVRRLGFGYMDMVEAVGFSGGIWCFWVESVDFTVYHKYSQVLHGTFNKGKPEE